MLNKAARLYATLLDDWKVEPIDTDRATDCL